jgi:ATP-binding protein involved in chromosome partitioning
VRGYAEVVAEDRSDLPGQIGDQRRRLVERLAGVGAVVAVVSGKGGVGKSAVTANLAVSLAAAGASVGALDADLNGPCLARMLGLSRDGLEDRADGVHPATGPSGVRGMSTELLLDENAPLRWKGPGSDRFVWQGATEAAVLREFLSDVVWGSLDYLLVDVPPGTDKIGRFLDLIPRPDQVLLVTIPSAAATSVVARSATFLAEAGVAPVGLVRNMVGYAPASGGAPLPLFSGPDMNGVSEPLDMEVWADIPFDPRLSQLTDAGRPPGAGCEGGVGRAMAALVARVESARGGREEPGP